MEMTMTMRMTANARAVFIARNFNQRLGIAFSDRIDDACMHTERRDKPHLKRWIFHLKRLNLLLDGAIERGFIQKIGRNDDTLGSRLDTAVERGSHIRLHSAQKSCF